MPARSRGTRRAGPRARGERGAAGCGAGNRCGATRRARARRGPRPWGGVSRVSRARPPGAAADTRFSTAARRWHGEPILGRHPPRRSYRGLRDPSSGGRRERGPPSDNCELTTDNCLGRSAYGEVSADLTRRSGHHPGRFLEAPCVSRRGDSPQAEEAPVGVEPTVADLQSAALATWLRCQKNPRTAFAARGKILYRPPRARSVSIGPKTVKTHADCRIIPDSPIAEKKKSGVERQEQGVGSGVAASAFSRHL